jgi:hypothetical protein
VVVARHLALCVYVIHGILVYGEEESAPRT